MIHDKIVISLGLAKKLKELNAPQKSLFMWEWFNEHCYDVKYYPFHCPKDNFSTHELYAAFTAGELLEILPSRVDTEKNEPFNHFRFDMQMFNIVEDHTVLRHYRINYHCDTAQLGSGSPFFALQLFKKNIHAANAADALAMTWIALKEGGYIDGINLFR